MAPENSRMSYRVTFWTILALDAASRHRRSHVVRRIYQLGKGFGGLCDREGATFVCGRVLCEGGRNVIRIRGWFHVEVMWR